MNSSESNTETEITDPICFVSQSQYKHTRRVATRTSAITVAYEVGNQLKTILKLKGAIMIKDNENDNNDNNEYDDDDDDDDNDDDDDDGDDDDDDDDDDVECFSTFKMKLNTKLFKQHLS